MKVIQYGLYLISLLSCGILNAQSTLEKIKFSRIETAAGLSNYRVTSILQDSRGFLWIGTDDGLNRFDGYDFKIYRYHIGDTTSLLKNSINRIYEDSRGVIWVATHHGGLHVYNRDRDNFTRIRGYTFNCEINELQEDKKNVWVAGIKSGAGFVDQYSKATGRLVRSTILPYANPVNCIMPISDSEFFIGMRDNGFYRWDRNENILHKFRADKSNPNSVVSNLFHGAVKDQYNNIWVATGGGLSKYDVSRNIFTNYTTQSKPALSANSILSVCVDGDFIWIGTENGGLNRLDIRTEQCAQFRFDKNDPSSVSDNSIWAIYKDREGRIWIGTYSKGLCIIDRLKEKFLELNIPLENDIVNAIWQDSRKRFWVGTEGGLIMKQGDRVRYFNPAESRNGTHASPVLSIYEDSKHELWFGTWERGLCRYNETSGTFKQYHPDAKIATSLSNPNVFTVGEDKSTGQLLVGTYGGMNILTDRKKGIFEHVLEKKFKFNNYIRVVTQDSRHNIWVGTIEELTVYDPAGKQLKRFDASSNPDSIAVTGVVQCILEDSKKRLWVATTNGLHLLIDQKFKKRYTTLDGLPSSCVAGILEDKNGNLWLSTSGGIARFNPETGAFRNYDVSDGLLSNEFNPNVCLRNADGQFFFGGKGINVFYPDSIKDNPNVPPVFITDLKLFNKSVSIGDEHGILSKNIIETQEVTLPYHYNFFSIQYVALNYTATEKNQYAYKLEGFDKDWNYVGSQRSVTYTNLDPGYYIFRVKASNNDGLWNEEGTYLIIQILPPWWKTWWFRFIAVVIIVGIAIGAYKLRVRNITERNELLQKLVTERTHELAHQNEELRQSQEEISAQRDLVTAQNEELEEARLTIEQQNYQIRSRNATLEAEVEERTRDLEEYNQQLEQFAYISAHNLRAPVARILGLGYVLEITRNNPDEREQILDKIVYTTRELDRVVKDLNTVLEVRKNTTAVIVPVNLKEELQMIRISLEKEIQESNAVILEDFSGVEVIYTIKPYMHSILINLISNAIKYRHPRRNPVIEIRSETVGEYIYMTVRDNGLGMDLSLYKDKLFTLYSRFHLHVEGKGMGLYLVRTQVNALGGKIEADSQLNEGTTFRLWIQNQIPTTPAS
ncbi:two-component regulator propeller domain-containing protein [Ohtaekwangia sp.]|uniref:two-component regulator propeller domain-containing protein n=1 Tax=Ohtaekwangia sp. TaxID=2066019 RepID=UPI002FDD2882